MPAVSVLLPCYAAAATLAEALDSLAAQDFTDYEIVAVDDGSTDATPEILAAWARREPRLVVLNQEHTGLVAALNRGLAACRGDLVARLDADDRCLPDRLASQVAYLHAHPEVGVLGCQVQIFGAQPPAAGLQRYVDWQNSLIDDAAIRAALFIESPLVHPGVCFRRRAVQAVGGYRAGSFPEDYDLWLRLYLAGARFARLPAVLLEWRDHPLRLTRTDQRYAVENFLRLKAWALAQAPLAGRSAVAIWGAGMIGRRLGKHLQRQGVPLAAYFDINPGRIGTQRRGLPVLPGEQLPAWWQAQPRPALLVAVSVAGIRPALQARFAALNLIEGQDWWFVS